MLHLGKTQDRCVQTLCLFVLEKERKEKEEDGEMNRFIAFCPESFVEGSGRKESGRRAKMKLLRETEREGAGSCT